MVVTLLMALVPPSTSECRIGQDAAADGGALQIQERWLASTRTVPVLVTVMLSRSSVPPVVASSVAGIADRVAAPVICSTPPGTVESIVPSLVMVVTLLEELVPAELQSAGLVRMPPLMVALSRSRIDGVTSI